MSNINNLTSKILDEAKKKSEEILKAAKEEEAKIIGKKIAEAREIEKGYIDKANIEAITKKERILSGAEIRIRDEKLSAKQRIVGKVFDETLKKLGKLSKEQLLKFIKESIINLDITGDEKLIVSKDDKDKITEEFLKDLNMSLSMKGKNGNITLSKEERSFNGGFILEKKGIEINYTFEAILQSMRDDLEYEVAKILFS